MHCSGACEIGSSAYRPKYPLLKERIGSIVSYVLFGALLTVSVLFCDQLLAVSKAVLCTQNG